MVFKKRYYVVRSNPQLETSHSFEYFCEVMENEKLTKKLLRCEINDAKKFDTINDAIHEFKEFATELKNKDLIPSAELFLSDFVCQTIDEYVEIKDFIPLDPDMMIWNI